MFPLSTLLTMTRRLREREFMIKIFQCNNGKYFESTCENNVNEHIKIDIYIYILIRIRRHT